MSAAARLYAVYDRLLASITDDEGFGGPVAHTATVDGWKLRIATSDFGDLLVSGRSEERITGYEAHDGPGGVQWTAVYRDSRPGDLDMLADLMDRAVWTDTIMRASSTAPSPRGGEA